ncbi:HNH endonuclease [Paenibacillus sp. NPDC058174]|uniref:HNH endonuclease n=1 Tax=Paenibacillus sp. NPDC058174 TaxID=3346366 RepID=UPI0036DF6DB2
MSLRKVIRAYKYIETVHSKLHEYVISFFLKIETDTKGFRDELFEVDFLPIVNRHRKILKKRFKTIYEYVSKLSVIDRQSFCQRIIESNQIEKICRGEYRPAAFVGKSTGIEHTLKGLFLDLYIQVLDGEPFREKAKTLLRHHFDQFCNTNEDITRCPICGIGELKKAHDTTRDQYDHYLPKSLYPLSSINFYNLVPCCKDCNSFEAKGDKDTIALSTGKLFFPYDSNHKGISLNVNVKNDNPEIEDILWELIFSSPDNKTNEIESWKTIYSIESRYQGYIRARIKKLYNYYFQFIRSPKVAHLDISDRKKLCILSFELNESLGLDFIFKPTLDGLLSGSNIVQAEVEALEYV